MDLLSLAGTAEHHAARMLHLLAGCAALLACRATPAEPSQQNAAESQAAQPTPAERLQFALPAEFVPLELRGEGSETLRAPAGASARSSAPGRVDVEAGAEFSLQIEFQPQLSPLSTVGDGARRVLQESDLAVFESAGGYWFVTLRELVPEWDESERRRVACSSAGATQKGAASDLPRFPRSAVERMVAACRSLALPTLD